MERLAEELRQPRKLRSFGTMLFDQQMWCWGRDVIRAEGNLLSAFGFVRYRPVLEDRSAQQHCIEGDPRQKVSGSGYVKVEEDGGWVGLWGWGMVYGNERDGGMFLRRFGFDPLWLDITALPDNLHSPDDLYLFRNDRDDCAESKLYRLFPAALRWIAAYEEWVRQTAGLAYREACVEQWFKEKFPAQDMIAAWKLLAARLSLDCRW
jgi:hypothetical protein